MSPNYESSQMTNSESIIDELKSNIKQHFNSSLKKMKDAIKIENQKTLNEIHNLSIKLQKEKSERKEFRKTMNELK